MSQKIKSKRRIQKKGNQTSRTNIRNLFATFQPFDDPLRKRNKRRNVRQGWGKGEGKGKSTSKLLEELGLMMPGSELVVYI